MQRYGWMRTIGSGMVAVALSVGCGAPMSSVKETVKGDPALTIGAREYFVKRPTNDPCWLDDLSEECVGPKENVLFYTGVSEVSFAEDKAVLSAQLNGIKQIVTDMQSYIEQSIVEAGASERAAGLIVAEADLEEMLFDASWNEIKGRTWGQKKTTRGWRFWDGLTWGPDKWKVYTLLEVDEVDLNRIEKEALEESSIIEEEVRERAKAILDKRIREKGLVEE